MLLLIIALLSAPAHAVQREGRWVPAVYLDAFLPGSNLRHLRDARGSACKNVQALGVQCTGSFGSFASLGGRAGLYYESEDYRWGASIGALTDGPDRGRLQINAGAAAPGTVAIKTQSTYIRLLGETSQKFLLGDDWYGSLGAGLGMAMSNETTLCSASGSLGSSCAGVGGTVNYGWVAWEIVPSLLYQEFEFGIRYGGAARGGHTPWNTVGVTTGWAFR